MIFPFKFSFNFISIIRAGIAINEQNTKYISQSSISTKNPDDPENIVLGIDINAVIRANCEAVNFLFVILAINARYAVYPIPAAKFSKEITVISKYILLPIKASTENPRVAKA